MHKAWITQSLSQQHAPPIEWKSVTVTTAEWQYSPRSAFACLDAIEAVRWACVLCNYGSEESAESYEEFFKSRIRRSAGEDHISETVALYHAASMRLALDMRGGISFDAAVAAIIKDTDCKNEQIERYRERVS